MSDLVEKVKRILSDNECQKYSVTAPAVIKAIADFLHQEDDEYSDDSSLYRAAVFLRARLKEPPHE